MNIRVFSRADLPEAAALWRECCAAGETAYRPLSDEAFEATFLKNPHYAEEYMLAARGEDGAFLGFLAGLIKREYLRGEDFYHTPGYLTMLMVKPAARRKGVASALLLELEARFRAIGKREARVTFRNPVNLTWLAPGTDGHDHNNAPGVDLDGAGYPLLQKLGYETLSVECGMHLDLASFALTGKYQEKRAALEEKGIEITLYDPGRHFGFEELFDALHGEVWRKTISDNLALARPLPVIVAADRGRIVGFAGPVDRQESGRGWFNGIATHPEYERRGIAYVMFCRLMHEFQQIGARFSTLFTDEGNPALGLYESVGFSVAKRWAVMKKEL